MHKLFGSAYEGRTVLVTGDTGFKGSWLCLWLEKLGATVIGYADNIPTRPSHYALLKMGYKSYRGDICDRVKLTSIIKKHKPDIVFHLAAQSLVRSSFMNPIETYRANVLGSLAVMEAVRMSGMVKGLINVTTDKVYENEEVIKAYVETDRIGGYDPYSSSKACVEILSDSYRRSFFDDAGILMVTARAGNVIGGGDWAKDRLVPDIMRSVGKNQQVVIRNPRSIRPWQHVLEPLSGYLLLGQRVLDKKADIAGAWNFGPDSDQCVSVLDVLKALQKSWTAVDYLLAAETDEKYHEAKILMLSFEKVRRQLGWESVWKLEATARHTAEWYKAYFKNRESLAEIQLDKYVKDAKRARMIWSI